MNQHIFGKVRVSVLTPRLLRVEHSPEGVFEDAPTQIVWNRTFPEFHCAFEEARGAVKVITEACVFIVSDKGKVRLIALEDGRVVRRCATHQFKKGNLKGTRRTLDATFGRVKLADGLISLDGVAVLDDSKSLLLSGDKETIMPRTHQSRDQYYFAYGRDYRTCLRDFYCLAGPVPMIPRYALGNWWSRYYAYTQQEYLDLMDKFEQEEIPLTVATIDMDWHWVDLKRFGELALQKGRGLKRSFWSSGWTGYSWNTDLFPDYRQFLKDLKARNLKVTMNLHPADGVRPFEDAYEAMAKAVGVDPASKEIIPFDLTEKTSREAYFECLHRPYEREGVDFWWIDWQQGKKSKLPGLDPLWALNHYHYRASAANAGAGLILSRYAGLGSHRYPLGFSGDTGINWRVLKFQPYFTANAANAGYGWWSHDIGGHHIGKNDDELYVRWLQFGVFNPVMRLHSTSNAFAGKEPWKRGGEARRLAGDFMRLRHRLIPYLYSMAARAHREGIALCEPLYYAYPDEPDAYAHENVYFFGSELIAAPITSKLDKVTQRAEVSLWLPEGRWTDIFTGQVYQGGMVHQIYRTIENIPVFAKAGAILPMNPPGSGNNSGAPATLTLDVWRGDNTFTLYEDEGETVFTMKEDGGELLFTIAGRKRDYAVNFRDIEAEPVILEDVGGAELRTKIIPRHTQTKKEALVDLITSFQMGTNRKKGVYTEFIGNPNAASIPGPKRCKGAILEILTTHSGSS